MPPAGCGIGCGWCGSAVRRSSGTRITSHMKPCTSSPSVRGPSQRRGHGVDHAMWGGGWGTTGAALVGGLTRSKAVESKIFGGGDDGHAVGALWLAPAARAPSRASHTPNACMSCTSGANRLVAPPMLPSRTASGTGEDTNGGPRRRRSSAHIAQLIERGCHSGVAVRLAFDSCARSSSRGSGGSGRSTPTASSRSALSKDVHVCPPLGAPASSTLGAALGASVDGLAHGQRNSEYQRIHLPPWLPRRMV